MTIFETILAPFIFFIEQVFLFSYHLTNSYGFAIILLSFVVSLLLLPVFIYIEKAKKKDDALKRKMKPRVDEIKRCYKGQERFYYLKTLNRQHNYSQTRALIPILSLLLQIPFFIAAYQYLEHFEPLIGVGFGFIKDLSQPDGILGVVNILPIIMTLVNLLTAYFYTKNGDNSERKQMLVVATIFLILLFNLPSGLVLYWTMNNVFSFFRLFITNPEVFRKSAHQETEARDRFKLKSILPTLKYSFAVVTLLIIASQISWAYRHNFDDIVPRILMSVFAGGGVAFLVSLLIQWLNLGRYFNKRFEIKPAIFLGMLFLAVYLFFAGLYHYGEENTGLINTGIWILFTCQIIVYIYFYKYLKSNPKLNFTLIATFVITTILLLVEIINGIVILTDAKVRLELFNTDIISLPGENYGGLFGGGFWSTVILSHYFFKYKERTLVTLPKKSWTIYILATLYLLGNILFWNPLIVYSSFPETFGFPAVSILSHNLLLFVILFAGTLLLYRFSSKLLKTILLFATTGLAIISFVYSSLIPIHLGTLQMGRYSAPEKLAVDPINFVLEIILAIGLVLVIRFLLKRKYTLQLIVALLVLNIATLSQAVFEAVESGDFLTKTGTVSINLSNSISFSKEKPNIVYVIADMFQGYHMKMILEEEPEIGKDYSGFTYYPNAASVSAATNSSLPALLGGMSQIPTILDQDTLRTIGKKITDIDQELFDKVTSNGYSYSSTKVSYSTIDINEYDTFLPTWTKEWNLFNAPLNIGKTKEVNYKVLTNNALLYAAPLFLKPGIYNGGEWLVSSDEKNENTTFAKIYNFIRVLPYISNTDNTKPSFTLIHSMATHQPWDIVDDEGTLIHDVSPYKNNLWFINTFKNWILWMKKNGVYDNTKIVLISDHGGHWAHYAGTEILEGVYRNVSNINMTELHALQFNPLVMVKDFGAKGNLKIDSRLMSNADAYSIIFDENDPTKGTPDPNREIPVFNSSWRKDVAAHKKFVYSSWYLVHGNSFDVNNWKKMEKPE